MIVEFGVALDVLVAVLVLGIFFFQIREQFDSLDLHHLESLRETGLPAGARSRHPEEH
jgi:hydrogenase-4 component E